MGKREAAKKRERDINIALYHCQGALEDIGAASALYPVADFQERAGKVRAAIYRLQDTLRANFDAN